MIEQNQWPSNFLNLNTTEMSCLGSKAGLKPSSWIMSHWRRYVTVLRRSNNKAVPNFTITWQITWRVIEDMPFLSVFFYSKSRHTVFALPCMLLVETNVDTVNTVKLSGNQRYLANSVYNAIKLSKFATK